MQILPDGFFRNGVELGRRVPHNFFSRLKSYSLQWYFRLHSVEEVGVTIYAVQHVLGNLQTKLLLLHTNNSFGTNFADNNYVRNDFCRWFCNTIPYHSREFLGADGTNSSRLHLVFRNRYIPNYKKNIYRNWIIFRKINKFIKFCSFIQMTFFLPIRW